MRIVDLFVGKGISGVGLAFAQAAVLMVLTGGLAHQSLLMLVALLLGALLVTGIGFLIAAAGRDMMSVMAWGVLAVLLLTVPSLSVMFPGTGSHWLRLIPTYYLVDTVNRVANYGAVWGDVWANLAILLALGLAFVWLGIVALRRKLR
jgi:ABC-2 type transport system permease protein